MPVSKKQDASKKSKLEPLRFSRPADDNAWTVRPVEATPHGNPRETDWAKNPEGAVYRIEEHDCITFYPEEGGELLNLFFLCDEMPDGRDVWGHYAAPYSSLTATLCEHDTNVMLYTDGYEISLVGGGLQQLLPYFQSGQVRSVIETSPYGDEEPFYSMRETEPQVGNIAFRNGESLAVTARLHRELEDEKLN